MSSTHCLVFSHPSITLPEYLPAGTRYYPTPSPQLNSVTCLFAELIQDGAVAAVVAGVGPPLFQELPDLQLQLAVRLLQAAHCLQVGSQAVVEVLHSPLLVPQDHGIAACTPSGTDPRGPSAHLEGQGRPRCHGTADSRVGGGGDLCPHAAGAAIDAGSTEARRLRSAGDGNSGRWKSTRVHGESCWEAHVSGRTAYQIVQRAETFTSGLQWGGHTEARSVFILSLASLLAIESPPTSPLPFPALLLHCSCSGCFHMSPQSFQFTYETVEQKQMVVCYLFMSPPKHCVPFKNVTEPKPAVNNRNAKQNRRET